MTATICAVPSPAAQSHDVQTAAFAGLHSGTIDTLAVICAAVVTNEKDTACQLDQLPSQAKP